MMSVESFALGLTVAINTAAIARPELLQRSQTALDRQWFSQLRQSRLELISGKLILTMVARDRV